MTAGTMTGIDYFAWFVLIVIILSVVYVFIALARLPGQIAAGHPQAQAINVAGWLGLLLTLGRRQLRRARKNESDETNNLQHPND